MRLTHCRPWRRHRTGRVALLMAGTVCLVLVLVLGPVPALAAPSVSEPADPVAADAAGPADAACLIQFDTPVDRMMAQLVKTPGAQSYAAVQEQCDSQPTAPGGGESPSGGTLTDANGNTYECTVRAGFNDACPATISVPYGPGGDTSGDYSVSPVESLHSPDEKTIFTIAAETIPAAGSYQVNSVVIAYDAGTGDQLDQGDRAYGRLLLLVPVPGSGAQP